LQFCHGATEELAVPPEHRTVQAFLAIANAAESVATSGPWRLLRARREQATRAPRRREA
jgi:hypothetical protein